MFNPIRALDMPQPAAPTIDGWVPTLRAEVGPLPSPSTSFLRHSVGCQASLRYLAALPPDHAVEGALFVSGWFEVEKPWDTLRSWLDTLIDFERVRAALRRCVVLSDNDPFTPDWRRNVRQWEERLGAAVIVIPGGRHINIPREPAVLDALQSRSDPAP